MIRPTKDNCLLALEPDVPEKTDSGLYVVTIDKSKAWAGRIGRVLAAGKGHHLQSGVFIPTEVKVGERVLVHVTAGDNYQYDKRKSFTAMYGSELDRFGIPRDSAEYRMVRNDEILCVFEDPSEVREGSAAAE